MILRVFLNMCRKLQTVLTPVLRGVIFDVTKDMQAGLCIRPEGISV